MVNLQDYILESKRFKTLRWNDLLFVDYRCLINQDSSEVWSHINYFAYVTQGRKKWKTQEEEVLLNSDQALFIRKGATTVYQYFDEPFDVLFVFIPDDFIKKILLKYPDLALSGGKSRQAVQALFPLELNSNFQYYFKSLLGFLEGELPPHKHLIRLKMEEFLLHILSYPGNDALRKYLFTMGHSHKINLEELMLANYNRPLSLKEYARLSARSLSSFRRDFIKIFKSTPSRWLSLKRLAYGRFLLESSEIGLDELTERCGFKNRTHFVKSFKDTYGLAPRAYRELHKS